MKKLFLILNIFIIIISAGCSSDAPISSVQTDLLPLLSKIVTGYVKGKDGVEIYIRIQGTGTPTIVLPGGPGYSFDYLQDVLTPLDTTLQLIYVDLRGCGKSQGFADPKKYNFDDMVADIESVKSVMGLKQFFIIGHETGGMLAQKYAIKNPNDVQRMVLMSSPADANDLNVWINSFRNFLPRAAVARIRAYERDSLFTDGQYSSGYEQEVFNGILSPNYFYNRTSIPENFSTPERSWPVYTEIWGQTGYFDISGSLKTFDTRDDLKGVNAKALILVGQHDYISSFVLESLHNSLSNSEMYMFENAGHFFYLEKHDEFISKIFEFLGKK
ncbi:MAG: alpha/beta fold hydrolase [Ignavibacteria bacterium]|nr:alpha/beta fold hydrolase [Ignavibacteria bacterium]